MTEGMRERIYSAGGGEIHYWVNDPPRGSVGEEAPGHNGSRPFKLEYSLVDKARWLFEILQKEEIRRPVLVGQSMGGYVAQCFMEQYPETASGFISIASAPLKRRYVTAAEIWMLKNCEWMYRIFRTESPVRLC